MRLSTYFFIESFAVLLVGPKVAVMIAFVRLVTEVVVMVKVAVFAPAGIATLAGT